MREVNSPFSTAHVTDFAYIYYLSTGLGWDKTGFTLDTVYAVVRLHDSSAKLVQTILCPVYK